MGCGKSTWGKKLAEKLDCAFIDIDKRIEAIEGGTVAEVFRSGCIEVNCFRKKCSHQLRWGHTLLFR